MTQRGTRPAVALRYDWLDRVTNMVDGVGTTKYTYTVGGQFLTEDGPFASDTLTNTYTNRLRVALSVTNFFDVVILANLRS